jgi:hypothetical protein
MMRDMGRLDASKMACLTLVISLKAPSVSSSRMK